MALATLTWFTIFACLIYVLVVDANVYPWLVLLSKSATIWLQRQWFLVRYNPDSPWIRWAIDRNARKIAKELTKEYENK
jgi:hypothetical protein